MGTSRTTTINERQLDVLKWIADGCPAREWRDFTYKASALALQSRGLVKVSKSGGRWTAVLTDQGLSFVSTGEDASQPMRRTRRPAGPRPAESAAVDGEDLVGQLKAAGGSLRIRDPDPETRRAYRRAISAALRNDSVPSDMFLRHTGRDSGDLDIRLVPVEESGKRRTPTSPIPVPATLDQRHPVVQHLEMHPDLLRVSEGSRDRALRIVQALADETDRRGHHISPRSDGAEGFRLTIGDDVFDLGIREKLVPLESFNPDALSQRRYPWQRLSPEIVLAPSGRLVLSLDRGNRDTKWADRKRSTLEDKLVEALDVMEEHAQSARYRRQQLTELRERNHHDWELARNRAREEYVQHLNRERLKEQVARSDHAKNIRQFCDRLEARIALETNAARGVDANDWLSWARSEADSIDPFVAGEDFGFLSPEAIPDDELDQFMPRGMNSRYPPV